MDTQKDKAKANSKIEGEGSYSATADYNKRQAEYLKKGTVDQDAQAAKRAIDSEEAQSLKDAEAKGKSRAK